MTTNVLLNSWTNGASACITSLGQIKTFLPQDEHSHPDLNFDPWTMMTPAVQINIPSLTRKSDVAKVVAWKLALTRLHVDYKDFIPVYTDESCTEQGSSSAFIILSLEAQQSFNLGHRTSSTASKLHAIFSATAYTQTTCQATMWMVCTD